jgi:hypothetical protein
LAAAEGGGSSDDEHGLFLQTVVDSANVAFAIFMIVQAERMKRPAAPTVLATQPCRFCLAPIALKASRCPHCTSELKAAAFRDRPPTSGASRRLTQVSFLLNDRAKAGQHPSARPAGGMISALGSGRREARPPSTAHSLLCRQTTAIAGRQGSVTAPRVEKHPGT